jgi:hypothetical protein
MLLHEYDFEITHRHGVKHNNADTVSRFPRASSGDNTGAHLDVEKIMLAIPGTGHAVHCMRGMHGAHTITVVLHVEPDIEYGAVVML